LINTQNILKIIILSNDLRRGGKERQITKLVNSLSCYDNIELILLLKRNIIEYDIIKKDNVLIIAPDKFKKKIGTFLFLFRQVSKLKPELLHCWEGGLTATAILVKWFLLFRGIKIIDGSIRYSKPFSFFSKTYFIIKFNTLFSNVVVSNSKAGFKGARLKISGKCKVIKNGISIDKFVRRLYNKNSDFLTLGQLASFSKPKDFVTIIKGSIELIREGIFLKIYFFGEGEERKFVENLIPIEFKNNFVFTGMIINVEEFLEIIDVGILLSKKKHSEGMSNSIMEYMASGLPVICTNTGGNPELVKDGLNGYLILHEDVSSFKAKILNFYYNRNLIEIMGLKSREIAEKEFNLNKVVMEYYSLYRGLIQ